MIMIDSFKNIFKSNRQKNKDKDKEIMWNPICKSGEEEFLIDSSTESEKVYTLTNRKGILTNSMITLSILPCLYLILSIMVIIILLFLQKKEADNLIRPIKYINRMTYTIPSFFELPKINQTIFHIYTCLTSISGLSIVAILFSVLKQRFKVPEYRDHSFKLYIMLFFGFTSNFLNFAKGFSPYLEVVNIKTLANTIDKDIKIELSQLLFIGLIFFSILFSMYSISVLDLLRSKKEGNSGSRSFSRNNCCSNSEDNWLNYKIVILTYLSLFTLIYIVFILHDNQIDLFSGTFMEFYYDKYHKFVITVFPYFIHIINAVLMFSFYFELKYVNLALSQNMEVDYLFDDSEKHIF
jgi:hypothetical protein